MISKVKLSDLCNIRYGKDHKSLKDGSIPVYGSGGIMRYVDTVLYDKKSVLIPRKGTLSNLFYVDEPFWTIDTLFYTKIDEDVVIPKYLFYKLKTLDLASKNVGTAVPSLTTALLNEIDIEIPSLLTQRSIANLLSSFDHKIENNNAIIANLEEQAQTIFKSWFVDSEPFQNEESVDNPLLEGIPSKYTFKKVIDTELYISDYVANGSFKSLKDNVNLLDEPDYALYVRNTDLKQKFNNQLKYVDKSSYKFLNKSKLEGYEIIISNVADVGRVYLCPDLKIPMTLGSNVILLNDMSDRNKNVYYYRLFKSPFGQHLIQSITGGSAQLKFNKTDFRNLYIMIPNDAVLQQYLKIAVPIEQLIMSYFHQNNKLTEIRDLLLPKLMSGEIRVGEVITEE